MITSVQDLFPLAESEQLSIQIHWEESTITNKQHLNKAE